MDEMMNAATAVTVVAIVLGMLSVRPPWLGIPPADVPPARGHADHLD